MKNAVTILIALLILLGAGPIRAADTSAIDPAMTTIVMDKPADWWASRWRAALPSGNGRIGAAVYGGVYKETVLLMHGDLWWQSKTQALPDVSANLAEVRRLLLDNKSKEANSVLANALKAKGYKPKVGVPLPLGDLSVVMPSREAFRDYQRKLDMQTGEVTVSWRDGKTRYERAMFVSRIDDTIVYEVRSDGPDPISARFALGLHDTEDAQAKMNRAEMALPEKNESVADGNYVCYAATDDVGKDFGAVARVIPMEGSPRDGTLPSGAGRQSGDWRSQVSGSEIQVTGARRVLVLVKVFIKGDRTKDWARLKGELAQIKGSYADLLAPHAAEHGRLFRAMTLDLKGEGRGRSNEELLLAAYKGELPTAMVEKMWAYGRYLLISSSREGGQPCELLGLWCGDYEGVWAFNMVNENLQMIYWQALAGNMAATMLPVFDYFDRLLPDFKTNAKNLYGCRGIFVPAPTAPDSGLIKHVAPHILHWTGGAGWVAQLYYDYYRYTGDKAFLQRRALPFMREVAHFYEDFFVVGKDGKFIDMPADSPENTPGNLGGAKANIQTTINATLDFAIAKELLTNLVEGARAAGVYGDEVGKWETMLTRIPPYQINEDGAVREWMHPFFTDNYHHRHESHLYPVFPGIEVTPEENPELFKAFEVAVKKRLVIGLKEQSGWSMAHMSNVYARSGAGDQALDCLSIMSRFCVYDNFYTAHNDWRDMGIGVDMAWAPFQIDANMGWTAAVQEMLLFSKPGLVRLLPALPTAWKQGKIEGMRCRGGIGVDMEWDMGKKRMSATLVSQSDQQIDLKFPGAVENIKVVEGGNEGDIGASKYGTAYRSIKLGAGRKVKLEITFK